MRLCFVTRLLLLTSAAAVLASCGGGNKSTTTSNTPATITVSTTNLSLTHGDVAQISGVQVLDSSNNAVSPAPTVTFASADPTSVTVTSAGLVCAGVFDANNIVCQTKDGSGNLLPDKQVNITVSAAGLNTTVPVFVHGHVDQVTVIGPGNAPKCLSQTQTEQFTAQAKSGGQDITSKVGPFSWTTGSSTVATVDTNGVVTSRNPGATTVVASIANTTGTPGVLVACPPQTISLHLAGATDTSFSVASGTSQTVAADVTDVLGQPITGATLAFSSFVPSAVTAASSGVLSTPGAGVSTIVASCTPPACNPASGPNVNFNGTGAGLAVYSNPFKATVTGAAVKTVYVTGSDNADGSANTSLIPIDTSTNTPGTAVTLPAAPNSMVFSRDGTKAYIGTANGLAIFDPGTNTVTATATGLTGKVLTVSNDGNKVVLSDTAAGKVFVFDAGANSSQPFDIANVTAADFAADNSKAYFTSGTNVYEYSPGTGLKTLTFAADGVVFTPQVSVAYFGGSSITGLAICNDSAIPGAAAAANILSVTPDGTHMIAVGAAGWADLSYAVTNSGCPAKATNTLTTAAGSFVDIPAQIAVASDDSNAFVTGYTGTTIATGVPFYHFADGTTGSIALSSAGALFSGGITQDAHSLYVGVGANGSTGPQVHRIDLTAASGPADTTPINLPSPFNPRIVVVRPQ